MDDRINTWTPGRVVDAIEQGNWSMLPPDWKDILRKSPYVVPWLEDD